MERSFFYIWYLYRRIIYRVFKYVDQSNGLTFTIVFFVLLPLPLSAVLILVFKFNRHLLSELFSCYALIFIVYSLYLAFQERKRKKYFEEFKNKPVKSYFKKLLILIGLLYPAWSIIGIFILKKLTR